MSYAKKPPVIQLAMNMPRPLDWESDRWGDVCKVTFNTHIFGPEGQKSLDALGLSNKSITLTRPDGLDAIAEAYVAYENLEDWRNMFLQKGGTCHGKDSPV